MTLGSGRPQVVKTREETNSRCRMHLVILAATGSRHVRFRKNLAAPCIDSTIEPTSNRATAFLWALTEHCFRHAWISDWGQSLRHHRLELQCLALSPHRCMPDKYQAGHRAHAINNHTPIRSLAIHILRPRDARKASEHRLAVKARRAAIRTLRVASMSPAGSSAKALTIQIPGES